MNEFVEQCRREWKRLRVPDPIAGEMAAELAADLQEAEAEGATAEEVLGSGASDARAFAASWAAERGVLPAPPRTAGLPRRALLLAAIAASTLLTATGAALVIFASHDTSAPVTAVRVPADFAAPRPPAPLIYLRVPPPPSFRSAGAPVRVWIDRDGQGVLLGERQTSGVELNKAGTILLIAGIVGTIPPLLLLLWSFRATPRRPTGFPLTSR